MTSSEKDSESEDGADTNDSDSCMMAPRSGTQIYAVSVNLGFLVANF